MEFTLFLFDADRIFSYVGKLLEQIYEKREQTLFLCNTHSIMQEIDKTLWTYSQLSFLPHDTMDGYSPSEQTLLLTTNINDRVVNNSQNLVHLTDNLLEIPECIMQEDCVYNFKKIMLILKNSPNEIQHNIRNPKQHISGLGKLLSKYKVEIKKWLIYHDINHSWQKISL